MPQNIIKLAHVYKKYRGQKKYALNGINLDLVDGDFYGLLGPNGSGKTTAISLIVGLIKQNKGDVLILGKKPNIQKNIIGYVPQEVALYETFTLLENMYFFAHLYKLPRKIIKEQVEFALTISQLNSVAHNKVYSFSGGMKRRANIAIALIHKPKVLILDEPTVGVDPQSRNLIFNNLKQINKVGTTILYSTHYLEEAELLCSKIGIIDSGVITKEGTLKQLLHENSGCKNLGQLFLKVTGTDVRDT